MLSADAAFIGVAALIFVSSLATTIVWSASMSAMGGMSMPGGWTMSMAWMRMPDQSWLEAAASFLGMWILMMAAMMLPSLAPMLWRYRKAIAARSEGRVGGATALVGAGYLFVWAAFGLAAFPLGAALAALEMRLPVIARNAPLAAGVVVLLAGALQFSRWKMQRLASCRGAPVRCIETPAEARAAWRHGLRLGSHCVRCCANLMAVLLVIGVMDLRAMALVAAAITAERLAPVGERAARAIGGVLILIGAAMIARAAIGAG